MFEKSESLGLASPDLTDITYQIPSPRLTAALLTRPETKEVVRRAAAQPKQIYTRISAVERSANQIRRGLPMLFDSPMDRSTAEYRTKTKKRITNEEMPRKTPDRPLSALTNTCGANNGLR